MMLWIAPSGKREEETLANDGESSQSSSTGKRPLSSGKMNSEQEARIREGVAKMPADFRKALKDWINLKEESILQMLGVNCHCLVLIVLLGCLLLVVAFVIGVFQVNILHPQVWHQVIAKARHMLSGARDPPSALAKLLHHDRAEL